MKHKPRRPTSPTIFWAPIFTVLWLVLIFGSITFNLLFRREGGGCG